MALKIESLNLYELDRINVVLCESTVSNLGGSRAVQHIFEALNELRSLKVAEMRERGEDD